MRQSNFELLRIVSMAMVLVWHFIVRSLIDIPGGADISMKMFDVYGVFGGGCPKTLIAWHSTTIS